ncbi:trigger factor-like [Rhagoletis pomonella]|uniref:trigger factor-like n=1 Tax=Rhagoletis pomonella TaxID=28610 RepID=UPI0017814AB9|nr:trigger factor-like [Rhagoletis pomonella]
MKNGQLQATGDYKEIELKYPHIVAKWQTVIAKVNQQAEDEESNVAAAGRTARERWKLYQNVAKLGLQRTKSSKVVATKIKAKAKVNNARTELREIVLDMNEGVGGDMASAGDAVVAITGREVGLAAIADKADDMTTAAVVMDNVAEFEEVETVEDEDDDDDGDGNGNGNGDDDSDDEDNEDEEEDLMPVVS